MEYIHIEMFAFWILVSFDCHVQPEGEIYYSTNAASAFLSSRDPSRNAEGLNAIHL